MIRIFAAAVALAALAVSGGAIADTYVAGHVGPNGVFIPGHIEHAPGPTGQPQTPTDGYASAYQAAGPQPRTTTTSADDSDAGISAYAPVSPRSGGANTQDLGDRYRMGPGADPVAASTRNTRGYRDGT